MKRCPECRKDYLDDSLMYCLDDGTPLVQGTVSDEPVTAILSGDRVSDDGLTKDLKSGETRSRAITFSLPAFLSGQRLPWIAAGVLALVAAVFAFAYFGRSSSTGGSGAVMLAFQAPAGLSFNDVQPDFSVISPDGRKIAFSAIADGKNMLYVRELDAIDAKLLPGSDNPLEPFWSPDSKSIAYGSNGKLKRSDLNGGGAQVLCDAARIVGGSWGKSDVIIFVPDYRLRVVQVSAKGGDPQEIRIKSDNFESERHSQPVFMPDGRHYLFGRSAQAVGQDIQRMGAWAGSLDSPEVKQILPNGSSVTYTPEGWLVYVRNDTLVAQAFDAVKLEVSGDPIPVISGLPNADANNRRFSLSDNGVLLWQGAWAREYQLAWFDREGKQVGTVEPPAKVGTGQDPRISPDGKHLVIKRNPPQTLWAIDLEKSTSVRITSDFGQMPLWSPDGSRIAYGGNTGLTTKASNGLGDPEVVLPSSLSGATFPCCWSPDGKFIVYQKRGVKTRLDLYALALDEKKEIPLLKSPFDERSPNLSPDGKWLAYDADDTGAPQIYVQRFSPDGTSVTDRKLISTNGGRMAVWRRDGGELYFIDADGQLMAAAVKTTGDTFEFAAPKALFQTRMLGPIGSFHEFDVSPDGKRFLIGTLVGDAKAPPPTVILNWTAGLKK